MSFNHYISGLVSVVDDNVDPVVSPFTNIVGTSDFTFNTALTSGDGVFDFSAAGSGNTGSIGVNVDLSSLPWPQFD